ncbi:hypothetical protein M0802_005736 [Mischocyttarus mexicanus]|nr:hypothetical protein M0802_005736 [Mischocyttarus mexicanus]
MALVPSNFFRNWWTDLDRYHRELDEYFQRSLNQDGFMRPPSLTSFKEMLTPMRNAWREMEEQVGGSASVEQDQDKYRVIVDVQQFAPEEITVRTDNQTITVEGKHEERKDQHGYISRQFVRKYQLPKGYDIGHVKPSLSSDGILSITAPRLVLPAPGERIVLIERENRPAIKGI